ncbi:zinc finger protein 599, partial [Clonorchis sinensis]
GLSSDCIEQRIFRHLTNLNRHKTDLHASQLGERKKPQCVKCGKAFRDAYDLNRHMRCHSIENSCVCPTCSQVFPNRGDLHKHKLLEHDKVPMHKVAKHECAVCKRWFEYTHVLERHSVVHTKQRPFVCVLCGKAYSQPAINDNLVQYLSKLYCIDANCESWAIGNPDCAIIIRLLKILRQPTTGFALPVRAHQATECAAPGRLMFHTQLPGNITKGSFSWGPEPVPVSPQYIVCCPRMSAPIVYWLRTAYDLIVAIVLLHTGRTALEQFFRRSEYTAFTIPYSCVKILDQSSTTECEFGPDTRMNVDAYSYKNHGCTVYQNVTLR